MSHLTHIQTKIKNIRVLQQTIEELISNGLDGVLTGAYFEHNALIRDPFGNSKLAELVVRRQQSFQGGYDFGFKLTESGEFEFLTRDGSKRDAQEFLKALMPKYAYLAAIASLQEQGFSIESETEENGTIKLVAGKWA